MEVDRNVLIKDQIGDNNGIKGENWIKLKIYKDDIHVGTFKMYINYIEVCTDIQQKKKRSLQENNI